MKEVLVFCLLSLYQWLRRYAASRLSVDVGYNLGVFTGHLLTYQELYINCQYEVLSLVLALPVADVTTKEMESMYDMEGERENVPTVGLI